MIELLRFINYLIELYKWVVIAAVILSWLMSLGVINPYNATVRTIAQALDAVTEPFLRPIRRWMPDTRPLDLSPIVLLLACLFLQMVVLPNIAKLIPG